MKDWELRQRQSLPLEAKIVLSKQRIREWYDYWDGNVHVSFSGGKDSTVLLNLVREIYPEVPAVFVDTGLEYPEIREFVKTFDNVIWLKPSKTFNKVISEHGYPVVSKKVAQYIRELKNPTPKNAHTRQLRLTGINQNGVECPSRKLSDKWRFLVNAPFKVSEKCCDVMKKEPFKKYEKLTGSKGILGIMACESSDREKEYKQNGCNAFNAKRPVSRPIAFWTEDDVLKYIKQYNLQFASVYGEIVEHNGKYFTTGQRRTGCMFCMFGIQNDGDENRFQRMALTHPKQYDYCINKLGLGEVLDYIGVDYRRNNLFDEVKT